MSWFTQCTINGTVSVFEMNLIKNTQLKCYMVKLKAEKKVLKSPLTHIVVKSVKNTGCPLKMSPGHLAIQRGGIFLWDNLYIATASMTTTVKCMYGETGDFVLSLLFAHSKQTQTNHTLCVWMRGLGVECGTWSYKLSWYNLCIINLRSQSSLQMPNHTISYAFCIWTCIVYETPDSAKSSDSYTVLYAMCLYSVHTCINLWTQFQSSDSYTKVCLIQMHIKTLAIHLPLMPQYQLVQVTQWRHRQVACHL